MKSLILFTVLFFNTKIFEIKKDYIRIEYVGSADKPMSVVYISKRTIPDSEQEITIKFDFMAYDYVVHDDEFQFIKNLVRSTEHKIFEVGDYNGFKITIRENDTDVFYFITRKNSNSLFLKSTKFLKKHKPRNEELIKQINIQRLANVFPVPASVIRARLKHKTVVPLHIN